MSQNLNKNEAAINNCGAMEPKTISKNGKYFTIKPIFLIK